MPTATVVVTVSREIGSYGSEIAERVAARLGWHLVDRRLVHALARRLGVPLEEAAARDERVSPILERIAWNLSVALPEYVAGAPPLRPTDRHFRELTEHILRRALDAGPCVIVGHGAQVVFAGRTDAFHVRVYAPRDVRIARLRERLGLDEAEAADRVRRTDADRAAYLRRHYGRDWTDPALYHLQMNTAYFGADEAAELIVRALR